MQQILFYFSSSMASVKIFLVNIKNWAVYKIFSIKNDFPIASQNAPIYIFCFA